MTSDKDRELPAGAKAAEERIEAKVREAAEKGDLNAVKALGEITRDKSFSLSKLDLFGGADKEGCFERIRDYIESGSPGTLSEKEQIYIEILTMVYSLDGQYGKRRTIKFLTSPPFGFSYSHASDVYAEAVELFYANRNVSKAALRQKMADEFDTLYIAARNSAKTVKDYETASNILANKAKVLQLDKEDPVQLPPETYLRPYRVLSLTPESIGLPTVSRYELARQIDGLVAPDAVKNRLKVEAGIMDMDITEILDNAAQEES